MAVLYCIKAVESVPAENVYSTEETRIGTWIDGKPLYRKTINVTSRNAVGWSFFENTSIDNLDNLVSIHALIHSSDVNWFPIPFYDGYYTIAIRYDRSLGGIGISFNDNSATYMHSKPIRVILEYTKITEITD